MLALGLLVGLLIGGTVGAVCMAAVAAARDPDPSIWPETELDRLTPEELREVLRSAGPVDAMTDIFPPTSGPIDDAPLARRRTLRAPDAGSVKHGARIAYR